MRLAIATITDGLPMTAEVTLGYAMAREQIVRDPSLVMMIDPPARVAEARDVVKARSRVARTFLEDTDCTHLLWWDADIVPSDVRVIRRMLESGFDVVGCPYPKKKHPESYPYRISGTDGETAAVEVYRDCVEVDGLGFGLMLTSRECISRMCEAYSEEMWFSDVADGGWRRTVAIFGLLFGPTIVAPDGSPFRPMLSEDFSFCTRWRAIGGRVMMYIGEGSPVGHAGRHMYQGSRAALIGEAPCTVR